MNITQHFHQRLNQRGISHHMIDCVLQFGQWRKDHCIISRKMAQHWIQQWQNLIRRSHWQQTSEQYTSVLKDAEDWLACMKKIADKGGLVVVMRVPLAGR